MSRGLAGLLVIGLLAGCRPAPGADGSEGADALPAAGTHADAEPARGPAPGPTRETAPAPDPEKTDPPSPGPAAVPPCDGPGPGCTCPEAKAPAPGTLEGPRPPCFPAFEGRAEPLPADVRAHMTGRSWREGCPVHLDDLALLTMVHWDMAGERQSGELVVAARVAGDVLGAFERLYDLRFPIARIRRVDHYDADDDRSMADNNTSAFNCRKVAGTKRYSQHGFGTAIDLNPVQNPYVRGERVLPPAGRAYLDRGDVRPGMLVPGPTVGAFDALGWGWGGRWRSVKDYQHVSESGR